jgi:pimeloyl-ACP methyl ester carboxylesterase
MPELRTAQDFREAPMRTIAAAGAQFAYRELGPRARVPLVLLTHLGENLDNRGPRIVDGPAQDRRVITVDYSGAGDSTGTVRNSMEAMAADMVALPDLCSSSTATAAGWCRRRTRQRWPATCPPRP